jgi:hypothetical protein
MKFRNKKKFRYGIPAYTGPFQALGKAQKNIDHEISSKNLQNARDE